MFDKRVKNVLERVRCIRVCLAKLTRILFYVAMEEHIIVPKYRHSAIEREIECSSSIWRLSKIIMIIGSSWGKFLNNNIIIVSQRMQLIQCAPSWHIAHASALNLSISILLSLFLFFARFFLTSPLCCEDSRLDLVYVFEFPIVANIYSQDRCRAFSCFQQFKLVLAPFLISSKIMQPTRARQKAFEWL